MRLLAISKNTFIETLRQPIYAVIIVFSLLLMLLAPAVSMYTLDEDIMLLRELGLSTLFLAGLFIARAQCNAVERIVVKDLGDWFGLQLIQPQELTHHD